MEILTKKQIIAKAPAKWESQYPDNYVFPDGRTSDDIRQKLQKENITEAEINEAIGNNSWTCNYCHECGEDVETAIMFGEGEYDYYILCKSCLQEAINKIETCK